MGVDIQIMAKKGKVPAESHESIRKLAPWFSDACITQFAFLELEYGFDVSGENIAYETVIKYTKGDHQVSVECEVGYPPRAYLNNQDLLMLANKSLKQRWQD